MLVTRDSQRSLMLLSKELVEASNGHTQMSVGRIPAMVNGTQDVAAQRLMQNGTQDIGGGPISGGTADRGDEDLFCDAEGLVRMLSAANEGRVRISCAQINSMSNGAICVGEPDKEGSEQPAPKPAPEDDREEEDEDE